MSQRKLSRQQRWRVEKVQAERARRAEKRERTDQRQLAEGEYGPEQLGRVVAHFGRNMEVEGSDGGRHLCHLRANLDTLVTGDRVSWREASDGSGVVEARHVTRRWSVRMLVDDSRAWRPTLTAS